MKKKLYVIVPLLLAFGMLVMYGCQTTSADRLSMVEKQLNAAESASVQADVVLEATKAALEAEPDNEKAQELVADIENIQEQKVLLTEKIAALSKIIEEANAKEVPNVGDEIVVVSQAGRQFVEYVPQQYQSWAKIGLTLLTAFGTYIAGVKRQEVQTKAAMATAKEYKVKYKAHDAALKEVAPTLDGNMQEKLSKVIGEKRIVYGVNNAT